MKDGCAPIQGHRRRTADPPTSPVTLPTRLIQRDLLEIVQELRRLEWRLDRLRDALDLPPGSLDLEGGRFRNETLEVTLFVVLRNLSDSLRRDAEHLRKMALPRPHLDLRGVRLHGVKR